MNADDAPFVLLLERHTEVWLSPPGSCSCVHIHMRVGAVHGNAADEVVPQKHHSATSIALERASISSSTSGLSSRHSSLPWKLASENLNGVQSQQR
jgi:hypothetical protein